MSIEIIAYTAPPPDWNQRMAAADSGLLQSGFWGSLMVDLCRGTPWYLEARLGEKCLASLLAVHMSRTPGQGGWVRRIGEYLSGLYRGRIEFGDGPVIHVPELASDSVGALLDWVGRYACAQGVRVIRSGGLPWATMVAESRIIAEVFAARGYKFMPWATFLVDLRPDEDLLLMSFDHAARKGIKKALREGITIRRLDTWQAYLDLFLLPYLKWTGAQESGKLSIADARLVWHHSGHHDYYRYYVAIHPDGTPLAVLGMYLFAGIATEVTSAISPEAIERKIPAQDLLHWEMFLAAKREGCHTFDLAGVSPDPKTPKEENIRRFKKKWGGRYVQYERYEWRHWLVSSAAQALGLMKRVGGLLRRGRPLPNRT
jgi:hypothetical protein